MQAVTMIMNLTAGLHRLTRVVSPPGVTNRETCCYFGSTSLVVSSCKERLCAYLHRTPACIDKSSGDCFHVEEV
jgi:hypothetical protein